MKKNILALIFTGIILLSSCNSKVIPNESIANNDLNKETELSQTLESYAALNYTSTELKEKYIEMFRDNNFIHNNSKLLEKYTNLGYKLSNDYTMKRMSLLDITQICYYPIEIDGDLVYINYMGDICVSAYGLKVGDAHIPEAISGNYVTLSASPIEKIIFKDNVIFAFSLNKIISSWDVPQEISEPIFYCGYSYFNGYIFKSGNNVYSIDLSHSESEFNLIATGVQNVIDADYCYSPDLWCTTLLHMEDGSVMTYIEWESELMPLYSDGEYSDVNTPNIPYKYRQ